MPNIDEQLNTSNQLVTELERIFGQMEPQIINWDPLAKLNRRDQELEHVAATSADIAKRLNNEVNFYDRETGRLEERQAKGEDPSSFANEKGALDALIQEVDDLQQDNNTLKQRYDQVKGHFEERIPR